MIEAVGGRVDEEGAVASGVAAVEQFFLIEDVIALSAVIIALFVQRLGGRVGAVGRVAVRASLRVGQSVIDAAGQIALFGIALRPVFLRVERHPGEGLIGHGSANDRRAGAGLAAGDRAQRVERGDDVQSAVLNGVDLAHVFADAGHCRGARGDYAGDVRAGHIDRAGRAHAVYRRSRDGGRADGLAVNVALLINRGDLRIGAAPDHGLAGRGREHGSAQIIAVFDTQIERRAFQIDRAGRVVVIDDHADGRAGMAVLERTGRYCDNAGLVRGHDAVLIDRGDRRIGAYILAHHAGVRGLRLHGDLRGLAHIDRGDGGREGERGGRGLLRHGNLNAYGFRRGIGRGRGDIGCAGGMGGHNAVRIDGGDARPAALPADRLRGA